MAKKSKIAKEAKRRGIVARHAADRADLRRRSVDPHLPAEEREAAMAALHRLPRDASPVRLRNRARWTGARGPSSASSGCRGSGCASWRTAANCPASRSRAGDAPKQGSHPRYRPAVFHGSSRASLEH